MLLQFTKLEWNEILKALEIHQDMRVYPTCSYHAKLSEWEVSQGGRC